MYEYTTKLIPTNISVVQTTSWSRVIIRLYPYSLSFSKIVWHTVRCGCTASNTIVLRNSKNNIITPVHSQLKLGPIVATSCTNLYIKYECTIDWWCEDTCHSVVTITNILNNSTKDNYLIGFWWEICCVSGVKCNGCRRHPLWKLKHQPEAAMSARQAHDVNTTSPQRRCNVMTLHRRWGDVIFTSCARWEKTYLRHVRRTKALIKLREGVFDMSLRWAHMSEDTFCSRCCSQDIYIYIAFDMALSFNQFLPIYLKYLDL